MNQKKGNEMGLLVDLSYTTHAKKKLITPEHFTDFELYEGVILNMLIKCGKLTRGTKGPIPKRVAWLTKDDVEEAVFKDICRILPELRDLVKYILP